MLGTDRPIPTDVGYSLLLLGHVAAAVIGFGALAMTGAQAGRARRGPDQAGADAVRRYFRPGVNWAGRILYLVPLLGFALVAAGRDAFSVSDLFVEIGFVLWLITVGAAEAVLWPAERRIQQIVSGAWGDPELQPELARCCAVVRAGASVTTAVFLVAVVLMVARP